MDLAGLREQLHTRGQLMLTVKVVPKSSDTQWAEDLADGTGKIRLAAVPEKGRANQELCRFLAGEFGVPQSQVQIVRGDTSPRKRVRIIA